MFVLDKSGLSISTLLDVDLPPNELSLYIASAFSGGGPASSSILFLLSSAMRLAGIVSVHL